MRPRFPRNFHCQRSGSETISRSRPVVAAAGISQHAWMRSCQSSRSPEQVLGMDLPRHNTQAREQLCHVRAPGRPGKARPAPVNPQNQRGVASSMAGTAPSDDVDHDRNSRPLHAASLFTEAMRPARHEPPTTSCCGHHAAAPSLRTVAFNYDDVLFVLETGISWLYD